MTRTLITLFCLFASVQSFAANVMMKVGVNNSWFASEGGENEKKPVYGFGILFTINDSSRTKIGIDILYVQQKMILNDISWQAHSPLVPNTCGAKIGDFHLHYHYLKMPVYFRTSLVQHQGISAHLKYGLSLNWTLDSTSKAKRSEYFPDMCAYDYKRVEMDRQPRYPIELVLGGSFGYKVIEIEAIYTLTLSKTEFMSVLDIQDRIHSIQIMMNLHFGLKK